MKNYFEEICDKLRKEIAIEKIEIVDNSYKHKSHKYFSPDKLHLHLKVKSFYLCSISKVNAHKKIMKILHEDIKTKIHALEISLEK
jgi:BolA family transcriptional regulator, general stress-responsive regulator